MKRVFTAKQFTIKCEWYGSRLEGGPDWCYRVWWNAPNGKTVPMSEIFFKKEDAKKFVAKTCKTSNALYAERENDPEAFARKYQKSN